MTVYFLLKELSDVYDRYGDLDVVVHKCPNCGDAEYQRAATSVRQVSQWGEMVVVFD